MSLLVADSTKVSEASLKFSAGIALFALLVSSVGIFSQNHLGYNAGFAASQSSDGCNFYVSPSGSSAGKGSASSPWALQTALNQPTGVVPGSVICLNGGTYKGVFNVQLKGNLSNPITVKSTPGQWAVIDGNVPGRGKGVAVLTDQYGWSQYVNFQDFEITNSNPPRVSTCSNSSSTCDSSNPTDMFVQDGVSTQAPGNKYINLIIHDLPGNGIGLWSGAANSQIIGSIIYNNGWAGPLDATSRNHGHGIYTQSQPSGDSRIISDVISFQNHATNIKLWNAANQSVNNYTISKSTMFNAGAIGRQHAAAERGESLFVGRGGGPGDFQPIKGLKVTDNSIYQEENKCAYANNSNSAGGYVCLPMMGLGYGNAQEAINEDVVVQRNNIVGSYRAFNINRFRKAIFTDNFIVSNCPEAAFDARVYDPKVGSNYQWNKNIYFCSNLTSYPYAEPFQLNINDVSQKAPWNSDPKSSSAFLYFDNPYYDQSQKDKDWQGISGFDANSIYKETRTRTPVKDLGTAADKFKDIVWPNPFTPGRANITIYNFEGRSSYVLNLSRTGLSTGQKYEVRDVQDYFGTPLATGTYQAGASVTLPLTSTKVAAAKGAVLTPATHTPSEFNAFVVVPVYMGGTVTPPPDLDNQLPIVSEASGTITDSGNYNLVGKAIDNTTVNKVVYALEGGSEVAATISPTAGGPNVSFSAILKLVSGVNNISVFAYDSSNNKSLAKKISVTYNPPTSSSNQLVYLKLNETTGNIASDSSTSGNSGTWVGTSTWVLGKQGNAASLNGTSFIDLTDKSYGSTDFTEALWIKPNCSDCWLIGNGEGSDFRLLGGKLFMQFYIPGTGYVSRTGLKTITKNEWSHVAVVKAGNSLVFYVNGVVDSTYSVPANTEFGFSAIGSKPSAGVFNGLIDEVNIYKKALTVSEIGTLANVTTSTPPPPTLLAPNIVSFTASASSITKGQSVRLSWKISGGIADELSVYEYLNGNYINPRNVKDLQYLDLSPNSSATYVLIAKNNAGNAASSQVPVKVMTPPQITAFTVNAASTASVTQGDKVTFNWTVIGDVNSISINNNVGSVFNSKCNIVINCKEFIVPTVGSFTYTLTATGVGKSVQSSVNIVVNSPKPVLTVSTNSVKPGEWVTLNWTTPANRGSKDWIGLYKVGSLNTQFLTFIYLPTDTGSKAFQANYSEGQYEFRYLLNDGYTSSATSNIFNIKK